MSPPTFTPTVAIDYDETLHPYSRGWTGVVPDDEPPTLGAVGFLRAMKMKGYNVIIFSVRAGEPGGAQAIQDWCTKYGLMQYIDGITNEKPHALAYVDDRAVPFNGNWMAALRDVEILSKRPKKIGAYKP